MRSFEKMRPDDEYQQVLLQREKDGLSFFNEYHAEFVHVPCPACGSDGKTFFKKYGFSHMLCPDCRTIYCSPRPDDSLTSRYYTQYLAPELWTRLLLKADLQRKIVQYTPRVEKIVAVLRAVGTSPGGIALDLGAGSGAFAACLKKTDFFGDVVALDISPSCVRACRDAGLSAKQGTINDVKSGSVDLICMNDLIEHVFDPFTLLKECCRTLKPGGCLAIATPNGEGFDFKILGKGTRNITPPEHLNYFNTFSLPLLLRKAGYRSVMIETPGILDVEMIKKEKENGYSLKEKNMYLDFLFDQDENVLENFQIFLSQNGLSSHMLCIAQKRRANQ